MNMKGVLGFDLTENWGKVFPKFPLIDREVNVYGDFYEGNKNPFGRIDFMAQTPYGGLVFLEADINSSAVKIDHVSKVLLYQAAYEIDNKMFYRNQYRKNHAAALIEGKNLSQRFKNVLSGCGIEWFAISSKTDGVKENILVTVDISLLGYKYEVYLKK